MVDGWIDTFDLDLTDDEKRLCAWIAEQAHAGVRRVRYDEVQAVLGMCGAEDLTRALRCLRERVDDVHDMVQSPIVNTAMPYFEIRPAAGYIWDRYCRAEAEADYAEPDAYEVEEVLAGC